MVYKKLIHKNSIRYIKGKNIMVFKLYGSSKNEETQRAVELAKIKSPEMKFYDIQDNPENLKEYMESCFGDKEGSPRIAEYEWREPYVTKDWEIFLNGLN